MKAGWKWAKHHTGHIMATKQLSLSWKNDSGSRRSARLRVQYECLVNDSEKWKERYIEIALPDCSYSWEVVYYSHLFYSGVDTVLLTCRLHYLIDTSHGGQYDNINCNMIEICQLSKILPCGLYTVSYHFNIYLWPMLKLAEQIFFMAELFSSVR